MEAATWDWIGQQITRWRAEADVARVPDLPAMREAARRISESGIAEGLVAYVVLGCEWLFRARLVKTADVEDVVRRLQEGFAKTLGDAHLAYLVTEALRSKIVQLVKREGRVSVPFGLYLPMESHLLAGLFPAIDDEEDRNRRPRPKRIAPSRRGPPPWPAPWIAAVVVKRMVERKGTSGARVAFGLVGALLGQNRNAARIDLATREKSLADEVIRVLVRDFEKYYQQLFRDPVPTEDGQGLRAADPERDWDWRVALERRMEFGAHNAFPGTPELVQEVLLTSPRTAKDGRAKNLP